MEEQAPFGRSGELWKADFCHVVARIIPKLQQWFQLFSLNPNGQILRIISSGNNRHRHKKKIIAALRREMISIHQGREPSPS